MHWTLLVTSAVLVISAFYASQITGEAAHDAVAGSLTEEAHELLEEHEELGEAVWKYAAAVLVLAAASFARPRWLRLGTGWLAVAAGCFVAWWVAETADHGGRLVYTHGAGGAGTKIKAATVATSSDAPSADPRVEFFRVSVRPLLVEACLRCHNPTRPRLPGGLDLTTIEGVLAGGTTGPAVVPGNPDASLLVTAVRHSDPTLTMPAKADKLTPDQIATLERWVREGVAWEAFQYQPPPREDPVAAPHPVEAPQAP
jgi:hypothetical protein